MPKLIFLNGCINAGKSTVAGRLKRIVPDLAHVEVDDLHGFISWMPIEKAIRLNLENAVAVTKNFLAAGLDVVFSYPLSRGDYEILRARFAGMDAELLPITLYVEQAIGKSDRGARALTEWERDRIDWMHENGLARPGIGPLVDTTRLTIEEAVDAVLRLSGLRRVDPGAEIRPLLGRAGPS
jgi:hypothetical protein